MPNKYRNEVVGILNGHEYKLRASFNALVEIEEALGMPLPKLQGLILDGQLRVKTGLIIFEKGLAAAGQQYDREQLLLDIEGEGATAFGTVIVDFMTAALFGGESLKKNLPDKSSNPVKTWIGRVISALR